MAIQTAPLMSLPATSPTLLCTQPRTSAMASAATSRPSASSGSKGPGQGTPTAYAPGTLRLGESSLRAQLLLRRAVMGGSTGCRREGLCQGRPHQGYTRDLSSRAKGTDSDGDAPMSFPAESSPQAQGSVPEGPPLGNGSAHEAGSLGVLSRPLDPEEFRAHAHRMVDYMADYYKSVHSMPVRSTVQQGYLAPQLPSSAPENPETLEEILKDVDRVVMPGMTHWQSPSFFAYYPAGSSTAGLLGDMLSAALNCIGFSWIASPAATELETLTLDWLGQLLSLPKQFLNTGSGGKGGGVIQGTASEAVLVCLLAARERALSLLQSQSHSPDSSLSPNPNGSPNGSHSTSHSWASDGSPNGSPSGPGAGAAGNAAEETARHLGRLVAITSDQAHSCVVKACRVAGLAPSNLRVIKASAANVYALSEEDVAAAVREVQEQGLVPFFICANVGTTSSAAVDPLPAFGRIAKACGAWLHVDAAYAGSACVCEEFRGCLDGVEHADSLCVNAHKWLLTNFDCSCLWVQDSSLLVNALSSQPEFLRNKATDAGATDYKDWQVPLGRRFRALKLWLVMRMYGASGLRQHIRHGVGLAEHFEALVRADPRFELVVPRRFSLVCFRLKALPGGKSTQEHAGEGEEREAALRRVNEEILETVNSSGEAFLTHTVLSGRYVIRMAIGCSQTEVEHVDQAWESIQKAAAKALQGKLQESKA